MSRKIKLLPSYQINLIEAFGQKKIIILKTGEHMNRSIKLLPDYQTNLIKTSTSLINYNLELHDIPEIWKETQGEGIKIGVLDTGLPNHPDLEGKVKDYANFTSDKEVDDIDGHSTHVSGKISGESKNKDIGIIGIAPKAELFIAKVMDKDGTGNDEGLAQGIDWCIKKGCQVLNLSLGATNIMAKYFPKTKKKILEAYSHNIYMFAAAGNEGVNHINFPAFMNEIFCIVAINNKEEHAPFSNTGPEVDFSGLGVNVMSTYLNSSYASLSGTSMATPDVAAIAALILSKHLNGKICGETPVTDFWQMREHLIRICTDIGPTGYDPIFGWGNLRFNKPNVKYDEKDMGGIVGEIKKSFWTKLLSIMLFWKII